MDLAASVIVTVLREPPDRLSRLLRALGDQDLEGGIELVLAAAPEEVDPLRLLRPAGAVRHVVVVGNPGGARSAGLNRAAAAASADVVCRLDARSVPEPGHVRRCLERLATDPLVGVVGGRQRPRPASSSVKAQGAARALANPWLLGAPAYRRRARSGPVDTVYLGAFRRGQLIEMGGYDERLEANEDFELADRYRRAGQVVWLEEGLDVGYEARASVDAVFRQYFAFGRSKVRYWRIRGDRPNPRQLAALAIGSIALATLAASAPHPRRVVGLLVAAVGATAALDHAADPHEPRVCVRLLSLATSWAVVSGWLGGVAREVVATRWLSSRSAGDRAGALRR
jgi:GT2 family glycosyltransferase